MSSVGASLFLVIASGDSLIVGNGLVVLLLDPVLVGTILEAKYFRYSVYLVS